MRRGSHEKQAEAGRISISENTPVMGRRFETSIHIEQEN